MKTKNLLTKALVIGLFAAAVSLAQASDAAASAEYDVRPTPIKTPPPVYPEDMKRQGIDGMVAMNLVIDEQGIVTECSVAKSSQAEFEQAALDVVKRWRFKPATKAGIAVKAQLVVPIRFVQES